MKTGIVALVLCVAAGANAFTPPMMVFGTRAVSKKAPVKKAPAVSRAAPESKGYPSFASQAQNFKISGISGGGNKAPASKWEPPNFADPKLQIERDPAFYAAAAATRLQKKKTELVIDDGLTELERRQRGSSLATFLTGSAKSQKDVSAIRDDIEVDPDDYFGLGADRFQLLFIAVFGLLALVGSLSGRLQL